MTKNDGFIHWHLAEVYWTGEGYQVELRTTIGVGATNWLTARLEDRLSKRFDTKVGIDAKPAIPAEPPAAGYEELGWLKIHPVPADAVTVYDVISDAVAAAAKEAEHAEKTGDKLQAELRQFGNPGLILAG